VAERAGCLRFLSNVVAQYEADPGPIADLDDHDPMESLFASVPEFERWAITAREAARPGSEADGNLNGGELSSSPTGRRRTLSPRRQQRD
jgi:hypothetical protein